MMHRGMLIVLLIAGAAAAPAASAQNTGTLAQDETHEATPLEASTAGDRNDASRATRLADEAAQQGDVLRGAAVFGSAQFACLSCHRVGHRGGTVGPDLTRIGAQRIPEQLVASVLWPHREVEPQYVTWKILTVDGEVLTGYREQPKDDSQFLLRDAATGEVRELSTEDIEAETAGGSLMPAELTAAMSEQQQRDLFRFLMSLRRNAPPSDVDAALAHAQMAHAPAEFTYQPGPLRPDQWPNHTRAVNRDRVYDFYGKQAEHFRQQPQPPMVVSAFPGLDGGEQGHWGNQNEETWASGRWNETDLGSVHSGVFHAEGITIARGVVVRVGDASEMSVCFNPDTLSYDAVWRGGFVSFSSVRHGFMHGMHMQGKPIAVARHNAPDEPYKYHGFYRHGKRVIFAYRIGDTEYLDSPWVEDGGFVRQVGPADSHPLRDHLAGGTPLWPQVIETNVLRGTGQPYAVDTIELPHDNPWKALLFCGGHDFLADGTALVCTMQGDVWHVEGFGDGTEGAGVARWRRFASGLHHPLGLLIDDDGVFVQCRDQLLRLHDLNEDGEADFYECFSNTFETSPAGHDFICGLERDPEGNFYTASGNQGLLRISPDGRRADVIATGFRNPDGLGLLPDGTITVPASEGEWTPASMICAVTPALAQASPPPHFGYRGPRDNQPPELPLVYLPRGLDNSSGGQVYADSDAWGPLRGQLIHLSFGMGRHFAVLRDVGNDRQGAVLPLPGDFLSGVHRGRFSPTDGQLYVTGMNGWGSYTPNDGCFQRVRFTGAPAQLPVGFQVYENGVAVRFSAPVDRAIAEMPRSHFAQSWNYRYSAAYGSLEYSPSHPGTAGHDVMKIASARVLDDGKTLFLEIPDLQPVNQLHLRMHVDSASAAASEGHDLFVTVHSLGEPFTEYPGYEARVKTIAAHPLLTDMALQTQSNPNPWREAIPGARPIDIATAENLTFATRTLTARAGEPIALTLRNPDVVPHNWALLEPGTLSRVGALANQLIADPKAVARHYIPETDDVLTYTDVVGPGESFTIYFHAPEQPGRYPYLCTFPGHWMVMNGTMIVE